MEETRRQTIEYKFLRQNIQHALPRMRFSFSIYLAIFHLTFIILYGFFATYSTTNGANKNEDNRLLPMFMGVNSMIFIGFAFFLTFLKRYGYGALGFNFLIAAYVLEWAVLIRGWFNSGLDGSGLFSIGLNSLMIANFSAAAVLISFGVVIGKATLSQLVIMATFEVIVQCINEYIAVDIFQAHDVGKSMYVHVFGAIFGLAVSRALFGSKEIASSRENSHYHSDFFAMFGTLFVWVYMPMFNSALAKEDFQLRAIVNTYLALMASCISTFIISLLIDKGRLNMTHIQCATLAGGIAVGAVADLPIQPYGAMLIGTTAGFVSTFGYFYLTPLLNRGVVHDTRGANSLHGLAGFISGLVSVIVAATATRSKFNGDELYSFYPARIPSLNSTDYQDLNIFLSPFQQGGPGRTASVQASYQLAALGMTIAFALVGGFITGFIMRIPIIEKIEEVEEMFDDEPNWCVPEDYSLKLTEVRVQQQNGSGVEEELLDKRVIDTNT